MNKNPEYIHEDACYEFAEDHSHLLDVPKALLAISDPTSIDGMIYNDTELQHLMDEIHDEFKMEVLSEFKYLHEDFEHMLSDAMTMGLYYYFVSVLTKIINVKGIDNLTVGDFNIDIPKTNIKHARHGYDDVLGSMFWIKRKA